MVDIQHHPQSALWPEAVADHWRLYLIEGIVLMLLGVAAVLVPVFASLAAAIFLGWLFLIGGIVGVVATLSGRHAPGFWWSLISGIITIGAGIVLLGWPFVGVVSLTLVLAAYLAADGIVTILFALDHRRQLSQRWGWLMVNGVVDLILAALIVTLLPAAGFWALGIIIGVDFIFGGASLIAMATTARPKHA
jgi:uncharacterized membrane protein HdeD (DUF308 family)